jgi:hypothetical protein
MSNENIQILVSALREEFPVKHTPFGEVFGVETNHPNRGPRTVYATSDENAAFFLLGTDCDVAITGDHGACVIIHNDGGFHTTFNYFKEEYGSEQHADIESVLCWLDKWGPFLFVPGPFGDQ